MRRWHDAMTEALYAPGTGFFTRVDTGPAAHFRTSAHTGRVFARAIKALVALVDTALAHPDPLDVVDVGAGRGELLTALWASAGDDLRGRLRLTAVELVERPPDVADAIAWRRDLPESVSGLLLATEWLDNVPLDVASRVERAWQYVLVDDAGTESVDGTVDAADAAWLDAWWADGERAEIGRPRDAAWVDAVSRVTRGLALAIDYGHTRADRPPFGTLTGHARGRGVTAVPDGSMDLTAHVAADAVATAGSAVAGTEPLLVRQSAALAALGVTATRPPIERAHTDPRGYLEALADATVSNELTDPSGLGDHLWLLQPVGIGQPLRMAG
jgi:SAM-dependent MidA family methyltransferase